MNFQESPFSLTRFFLISLISLVLISGCDDDTVDPIPDPEPTAQYDNTAIQSTFISETYPLKIYLPAVYENDKNLPVVYLLDGESYFDNLISYQSQIGLDAIVVGIGDLAAQADATGNLELWAKRDRDFLPDGCGGLVDGRQLDFYKFLTQEVVPFIDSKYESDHNSRTLISHGKAGIFSTVAMFMEDPENIMFHGFIAANPGWDSQLLCNADFFDSMLQNIDFSEWNQNIKFHFSQSNGYNFEWFNEYLGAKAYPWLDVDFVVFPNDDFLGVAEPSFKQGLAFVYDIE